MSGGAAAAIRIENVSHAFDGVEVLRGISAEVGGGEILAIAGPSGCGKSTLLELAAGLTHPDRGRIAIDGEDAAGRRLSATAYMPQRDLLLPWLRAIDNAALGLRLAGRTRREARERARPVFERLGLGGFDGARPDELSGGMRQRVAFARTLLAGSPVLLLDEPLAALDAITRADLQEWLLAALTAERRTALLVTHDVEEALYLGDRVMVLSPRPGRCVLELRSPAGRDQPRPRAVTQPEFIAARERALTALAGERG